MKSLSAAARDAVSLAQVLHDLKQFDPLAQKLLQWITEENMPQVQCMPKVLNMICEQGMVLLSFLWKVDVYTSLEKDAVDLESELPESIRSVCDCTCQKLVLYSGELLTKVTGAVGEAWKGKTHENDAPICVHTKELLSLLIWAKALWLWL